MKRACFALLALAILPLSLFGHLGETEQELVGRYGPPISRGAESTFAQGKVVQIGSKIAFLQGDWTIDCALVDGRCARVVYSKKGDWAEDQFTAVLTANSQGDRWTDISEEMTKRLTRRWRRGDGGTAIWNLGTGVVVTTPAYYHAKQLAEAKARADAASIPKL